MVMVVAVMVVSMERRNELSWINANSINSTKDKYLLGTTTVYIKRHEAEIDRHIIWM